MNKILIGLTSAALMALIAAPALAVGCPGPWCIPQPSSDVTVSNYNSAFVNNSVSVSASTGKNDANGGKGGTIITGDAYTLTTVNNQINSNYTKVVAPCANCKGDIKITSTNNAFVNNNVSVSASTGKNDANGSGWFGQGGTIITGGTNTQTSVVNMINSNVTRIIR